MSRFGAGGVDGIRAVDIKLAKLDIATIPSRDASPRNSMRMNQPSLCVVGFSFDEVFACCLTADGLA